MSPAPRANVSDRTVRNRWEVAMRRIPLAAALAAAALAGTGCRRADATPAAAAEPPRPIEAARPVARLSAPAKVRFAPEVIATGTLKSQQAAQLAFAVSGTLDRILVKRGQAVAEGAPLGALDADAARAAVAQAEAALEAAKAQARLAEDAHARVARIRKEDGASESQLVQAEAQRDLAAAQALAARAQLQQAQVSLSKHVLRAPFAGVVTRVPDGAGITVAPGVPLFTLDSTHTLTLETSLTQEDASELRPGARVTVVVPATGARAEATVRVVGPAVDPATNRVPVAVSVPTPDGRLLPHAFARAHFPSAAERDGLRVPLAALVQRDGAFSVWIAGADGRARSLPVRVLGQQGDAAVVDPGPDGWPAGARVIETPPLGLADGTAVAEAAAR